MTNNLMTSTEAASIVYELVKIGELLHKIYMKQEAIVALISHSTKSRYDSISGEVVDL